MSTIHKCTDTNIYNPTEILPAVLEYVCVKISRSSLEQKVPPIQSSPTKLKTIRVWFFRNTLKMQTPINWKKEISAKEKSRKYENYEKSFVVFLQAERSKLKRFETQGSGPICGKVIKFQENENAAKFSEMYLSQSSNVLVQDIGCKFLWNFVLHQEGCNCSDCSAIFSEPSEFALSTFPERRIKKIGFTLKCIFLNS